MPLVGVNLFVDTPIGPNPINANNLSKVLMMALALIYVLRAAGRQKISISRETLLYGLVAYSIYFLANTIDIFWYAVGATNSMPSVASFLLTPLLIYLIPYLAVKSMLTNPRHIERFLQGVVVSLWWLMVVTFLQLNYLFGLVPQLSTLYGDVLYKFTESRWGGWGSFTDIAPDFPLIGWQLRPSGSFQEPSVFASYIFIFAAPLFIALHKTQLMFLSRRMAVTGVFLVALLLVLSLSSTALVAITSLVIYRLLVKFRFSASGMVISYLPILFLFGCLAMIFNQEIGRAVLGSNSLETRFGGFVGSVEQVFHYPFGTGFRFSAESLGQFVPEWARNEEFYVQQDNQWFVSTVFGTQVVNWIGIVPFGWLLLLVYQQMRRYEPNAPAFSRRLLHAYVWCLIVSSFAAIQYQEPWVVYAIVIAYLFPRAGVGVSNGQIFIQRLRGETGKFE